MKTPNDCLCRLCLEKKHKAWCIPIPVSIMETVHGIEKFMCERCGAIFAVVKEEAQ